MTERCAACRSPGLELILDYGRIPLAGAFPKSLEGPLHQGFPLTLRVCPTCFLVQVPESVDASVLFNDYRYLASVPLAEHFEAYARHVPDLLGTASEDLIVEVGCNDGVLLHPLHRLGYRNLVGIDPARNITAQIRHDIPILSEFFGIKSAQEVLSDHGPARLIAANNVFAHVADLHDFLAGVSALLAADGHFVFEVHYLSDLLDGVQYDTVYHEHRYYYSLTALIPLLARHELVVTEVEHLQNHGGSIRVYATRSGGPSSTVRRMLAAEHADGVDSVDRYERFAGDVRQSVMQLAELVSALPKSDVVAAFGAAGRAVTLLNYVPELGSRLLYVMDESPERKGRYVPGARIPIVGIEELGSRPPSTVVLTAWTYADVLRQKVLDVMAPQAPAFIVPLPAARYM